MITTVSKRLPFQLRAVVRGLAKVESRTELDTHADTCVVGKNCLIVNEYDRWVTVTGYDPQQGCVKDLRVVAVVLAHDCPKSGEVKIISKHIVDTNYTVRPPHITSPSL